MAAHLDATQSSFRDSPISVRNHVVILTLLLTTFLLRFIFGVYLTPPMLSDARAYDRIAQNLIAGNGFSESRSMPYVFTTIRDKLYPVTLAGIYYIFGTSHIVVFAFQALLSTITGFLIYRLARNLFGMRIGLLSVTLFMIYLPSIAYAGMLLTETMYVFLIVLGTWLLFEGDRKRNLTFVLAGMVFGLATLTRTEGVMYAALLVAFMIWRSKDRGTLAKHAVLLFCVLGLILLPVVYWNYTSTGRIMLRDPAVFLTVLRLATGQHDFSDPLYGAIAFNPGGPMESERTDIERQIIDDYFREIVKDPIGFLWFRGYQLLRLWTYGSDGLPVTNMSIFDLLKKGDYAQFAMRMTVFLTFGPLMLILIAIGVATGISKVPDSAILVIFPLYSTVFGIFFYTVFRYSLPGQVLLIPMMAFGIDWLWKKFFTKPRKRMSASSRT